MRSREREGVAMTTKWKKLPLADDWMFYGEASHGWRFYCFPDGQFRFWRLVDGFHIGATPSEELVIEVKRRWLAEAA
jgi:hypothetical protein